MKIVKNLIKETSYSLAKLKKIWIGIYFLELKKKNVIKKSTVELFIFLKLANIG